MEARKTVTVEIRGEKRNYPVGTPYREIARDCAGLLGEPEEQIALAVEDGKLREGLPAGFFDAAGRGGTPQLRAHGPHALFEGCAG